jgi:hypothetical protein
MSVERPSNFPADWCQNHFNNEICYTFLQVWERRADLDKIESSWNARLHDVRSNLS